MSFEENWKEKVYDRRYVAVCEGRVEPREGTVESWLKDNKAFQEHCPEGVGYTAEQSPKSTQLVPCLLSLGLLTHTGTHLMA